MEEIAYVNAAKSIFNKEGRVISCSIWKMKRSQLRFDSTRYS